MCVCTRTRIRIPDIVMPLILALSSLIIIDHMERQWKHHIKNTIDHLNLESLRKEIQ